MSFLFKRSPRNPPELVRIFNDTIVKIEPNDNKKYQDECGKYIKQIKLVLHGDDDQDPQPDQISLLAQEIYATDSLYLMVLHLNKLDFDSRKDVAMVFLTLLRRRIGNKSPTVEYLLNHKPEIISLLVRGQEGVEIGLVCGSILRDCIKFDGINGYILHRDFVWKYFGYVQNDMFEIATDSFNTLHDLLTVHKLLVSGFLAENYEPFTNNINKLITSPNYVTKRQSVRLLSELVLTKTNQSFLNRYFDDTNNLKMMMLLLSDKLKNLQIEGFHIFKFFVAKPKKCQKVSDVLMKNRDNFIEFFEKFDVNGFNDGNLIDERDYILNEIKKMPVVRRG